MRINVFINSVLIINILIFSASLKCETLKDMVLGDKSQSSYWIYLGGLTESFDSDFEQNNRKIIDSLGIKANQKIIAIRYGFRCPDFENKLCWPHSNSVELNNTFDYIKSKIDLGNLKGYIGFSNGGFFLNYLAQHISLSKPIITIGSFASINNNPATNNIDLIIGKNDLYHYNSAIKFFNSSLSYPNFNIKLYEFNEGHVIPEQLLFKVIRSHLIKHKSQANN